MKGDALVPLAVAEGAPAVRIVAGGRISADWVVVVNVTWVVEFDTTIVEVKKVVRSEMVVREKLKDESVV